MKHTCFLLPWIGYWASLALPLDAQTFDAFTEPVRAIDVSAADTGQVAEVKVQRGDRIRRGDLLMVLDTHLLQASRQVAQRKANNSARLKALQVEFELQHNRYQQLLALLDEGAGSPEEVRRAKANTEMARLNVRAARDDQELAHLQLGEIEARIEQRRIRSPIDGVITDVLKEPGEYVSTSDPHVMTVVQLDQLRATFYLPTKTATHLVAGKSLPLTLVGSDQDTPSVITYVAPVTDADSGRVRVDVLIENRNHTIRSGVRCILKDGN